MQPVLATSAADGFALWPVDERESYGYLVLDGERTASEVGMAVMRIADCNGFQPEEEHGPCPTDPLGTLLHGLLTLPDLIAVGGFRVTDNATGIVFVGLAETWADQHLPARAATVTAALARALDLTPAPWPAS